MRVLILTPGMHPPWVDGRITSLKTLAEAWVEKGTEVEVLTTGPLGSGEVGTYAENGVRYEVLPGGNKRNWRSWARHFWRECGKRKWDLVLYRPFAGYNWLNVVGIGIFRLISLVHGVPFALALWSGPAEMLAVPWFFSGILITARKGTGQPRVIAIPPIVKLAHPPGNSPTWEPLRRLGIQGQDHVYLFTYCGKVYTETLWRYTMAERGLQDLMDAAALLREVSGLKILVSMPMLAQPETREMLKGHLEQRGVGHLFVLTHELDNLDEVLRAVDAYLYPIDLDEVSWAPLSVLEAFACGTPVITTRVPAVLQFVDDGEALLYEPGQAEELAGLMWRLFSEPGLAAQLRERSRRKVELFDCRGKAAEETLQALSQFTR